VKRVDAQIEEIDSTLRREKSNLVQRIQNEYEAAVQRESMLSSAYNKQAQRIAGRTDSAAEHAGLLRQVQTTQQTYDMLLKQLNNTMLTAAAPGSAVEILEEAVPAALPSKPTPAKTIALSTFAGAGLVYGIFVLFAFLAQRKLANVFADPGHAGEHLRVPELGVIPRIEPAPSSRRSLTSRLPVALRRTSDVEEKPELVTHERPQSMMAEAFRIALSSLTGGRAHSWKSSFIVTSTGPQEGKTTVAANLAIAAAQTGRSVLLLDFDWRRPRIHNIFEVSNDQGFLDVLSASTPNLAEALAGSIYSTVIPGLSVMPSGRMAEDSSGHIGFNENLRHVMEVLKHRFDTIVVDTPPALHFVDARLIAVHADGVVLVVRAGQTVRESATRVLQGLIRANVPVLGTILNAWDPAGANTEYSRVYETYCKASAE
jgi:succinoglycan biosynthesis transport protein ExoP